MVSLNFLDENTKVLANLKYECFNKKKTKMTKVHVDSSIFCRISFRSNKCTTSLKHGVNKPSNQIHWVSPTPTQ